MQKIIALYTSFDGRLRRRNFWLGVLGILVFSVVVSALLMLAGFGETISGTGTVQIDGGQSGQYSFSETTLNSWASLAITLITAIPSIAIAVKRRHDRDNSGIDAKLIIGLIILLQILQSAGVVFVGYVMVGANLILGIAAIYLLVVTGFLKATATQTATARIRWSRLTDDRSGLASKRVTA